MSGSLPSASRSSTYADASSSSTSSMAAASAGSTSADCVVSTAVLLPPRAGAAPSAAPSLPAAPPPLPLPRSPGGVAAATPRAFAAPTRWVASCPGAEGRLPLLPLSAAVAGGAGAAGGGAVYRVRARVQAVWPRDYTKACILIGGGEGGGGGAAGGEWLPVGSPSVRRSLAADLEPSSPPGGAGAGAGAASPRSPPAPLEKAWVFYLQLLLVGVEEAEGRRVTVLNALLGPAEAARFFPGLPACDFGAKENRDAAKELARRLAALTEEGAGVTVALKAYVPKAGGAPAYQVCGTVLHA